jgi:uncharacterized membrane protein
VSERLATTITLYGLFVAAWSLLPLVFGARPGPTLIAGGVLFELALTAQAVAAAITWAGGHEPNEPGVFAGYVLASVAVLPAASAFAQRRSAWDYAIVAAACVALAVVSWRMTVTW